MTVMVTVSNKTLLSYLNYDLHSLMSYRWDVSTLELRTVIQKGKNGSCGDTPLAMKTCHTVFSTG
jgi:hypothetical protein